MNVYKCGHGFLFSSHSEHTWNEMVLVCFFTICCCCYHYYYYWCWQRTNARMFMHIQSFTHSDLHMWVHTHGYNYSCLATFLLVTSRRTYNILHISSSTYTMTMTVSGANRWAANTCIFIYSVGVVPHMCTYSNVFEDIGSIDSADQEYVLYNTITRFPTCHTKILAIYSNGAVDVAVAPHSSISTIYFYTEILTRVLYIIV